MSALHPSEIANSNDSDPFDPAHVKKTVLLYGILGGLLVAVLKVVEYRFLVLEHSLEIYGGIIALIFSALGIWLGLKLTRTRETVVTREVPVEVRVPVPAAGPFVRNEARGRAARHHAAGARDPRGDGGGAQQPRDRRTAVRQREHREDTRRPSVRQARCPAPNAGRAAREGGGTRSPERVIFGVLAQNHPFW